MKGIDIYEGDNIQDWNDVKNAGIEVVIQKASQGTSHVDSLLQYRYPRIKDAGLKIGFYHFAQYNSTNPIAEAQHFLSTIAGLESDTVLWLDIEIDDKWDKQVAINYANTFIDYVRNQGHEIGIYTGDNFFHAYLENNIPSIPLWIASYGRQPNLYPDNASWQYTDQGQLNGIVGNVDLDYFIDNIFIEKEIKPKKKIAPKYDETIPESIIYYQIPNMPFYFEKREDKGMGIHLDRGNYITINKGSISAYVNDNNGYGDSNVLIDVKENNFLSSKYDESVPDGNNYYQIPGTNFYFERREDGGLSIHMDRGNYITIRKGEIEIICNDNKGHYYYKNLIKANKALSTKYEESIPTGINYYQIPNMTFYIEKRTDCGMGIHLDRGNYITINKGSIIVFVNDNNGNSNIKKIL